MGEYFEALPEEIREHIRKLAAPAGLRAGAEAEETLAQGWHEKHQAFARHTAERGMVSVDAFRRDDPGGALAMTCSGSILSIGPLIDGARSVAYASIGARRDVPQMSVTQGAALARDLSVGESAEFIDGPVSKTSPVFAVAVFHQQLEAQAENTALVVVTDVLAQRFAQINRERAPWLQE